MKYSITFLESDYEELTASLFPAETERAAYLLCGLAKGPSETRLLVREVIPVEQYQIRSASRAHLSIPANTYVRWFKHADSSRQMLVFVHSHPEDVPDYSNQDDLEEPLFFESAYKRIHLANAIHASLLFASPKLVKGRVWLGDGSMHRVSTVRILGRRFRFVGQHASVHDWDCFDRQTRAFGREFQPLLKSLHVGVVGVGGTGSSVAEQLIRLGVGTLTVVDQGRFEKSNINRVYGSAVTDDTLPKPQITKRLANSVGLGTVVHTINKPITYRSVLSELKDCDVVFGCTDDQWGRSLLTLFAIYYLIPVFDMGVAIDSGEDGQIDRVEGRVTTLIPGAACLFCRKRINPDAIRSEEAHELRPSEAESLRREGYLLGLPETAPSVIPFTTTIAAAAVSEFLHRLTGFMGADRRTTEVIQRFDWNRIRTNATEPASDCLCSDRARWGRGDVRPMLDIMWRPEA
jgi:molybdopterin/thiamine biosynthesis adenylyltransferase